MYTEDNNRKVNAVIQNITNGLKKLSTNFQQLLKYRNNKKRRQSLS